MTAAQLKFYRVLWSRARTVLRARKLTSAECEQERHALHVRALGYDKSSTELTNAEFDLVKAEFLAVARPGDYRAQAAQVHMPATRKLTFIRHLLAALQKPESYADAILNRMEIVGTSSFPQKSKKWTPELIEEKLDAREAKAARQPSLRTLDTAPEAQLKDVMIALKRECRRHWKTKDLLLWEIATVRLGSYLDEAATMDKILSALAWPAETKIVRLDEMVYEDLLVVLAVLRGLAGDAPAVAVMHEDAEEEIDQPF